MAVKDSVISDENRPPEFNKTFKELGSNIEDRNMQYFQPLGDALMKSFAVCKQHFLILFAVCKQQI